MGSIHIEIDSLEGLNDRLEAMLDWETHSSVIREPGTGKIISYSPEKLLQPRLLGWSVVTSFGASILRSPTMLYQGCAIFTLAMFSARMAYMTTNPDEGLLVGFEGLEDALHALIVFLLGLFLAEVISGWKTMFCEDEVGAWVRACS